MSLPLFSGKKNEGGGMELGRVEWREGGQEMTFCLLQYSATNDCKNQVCLHSCREREDLKRLAEGEGKASHPTANSSFCRANKKGVRYAIFIKSALE